MDEFPLRLRDTTWDVVNLSMVLGIIVLNWITLFGYLIVRTVKRKRENDKNPNAALKKKIPSKADRPFYVTGLVFASTNWLLGTLFTTGTVSLRDGDSAEHIPAVSIYAIQYLGGALLWIWLTIDRMLARYASVRFAGEAKEKNGIILRYVAAVSSFLPFLILGIVAIAMDKVEINSLGVTDQDDIFEILMGVYHGLMLVGVSFLIFKLRKIIGNFHELIRYIIFVGLAMVFFAYDACTTLIHPLQKAVEAQQVMCLVVLLITTTCIYWIFALAMKPRKIAKVVDEELAPLDTVKKAMNDSDAINHFIDEDSCGANEPNSNSKAIFDQTKQILWYRPPRTSLHAPSQKQAPSFIEFVRQLPDELVDGIELDKDTGIFAQPSSVQQRVKYKPLVGYMLTLK